MAYPKHLIKKFLKESNDIECEDWNLLPYDAFTFAMSLCGKSITPGDIMTIHKLHEEEFTDFKHGDPRIAFGKFRTCGVRVGGKVCPAPHLVPMMMSLYCDEWNKMDSYTAHRRFENTHPFEDLNGRVGRLLWLIKAVEEGYHIEDRAFLHQFYYQALSNFQL